MWRGSCSAMDWDMTTQTSKQERDAHTRGERREEWEWQGRTHGRKELWTNVWTEEDHSPKGQSRETETRRMGLNLLHKLLDNHIPKCFALVYERGRKQRLRGGFDSNRLFKHFNAPGIQLEDAIIFFTTQPTSPLFSPYNCTSSTYFTASWRFDVWLPCVILPSSMSITYAKGSTLSSKEWHTSSWVCCHRQAAKD